jgi:dienelactone hydrolase
LKFADALKAYERFEFTDPQGRWTRPVWRRGAGPAVIVIHEMPGLHPLVIRFGDRLAQAGMTVFLPSLFGEPGRPVSLGYAAGELFKGICIRREFNVWAHDRSSPIVDWLRALASFAHDACGGRGVGAVGMCFTGNFALAMMTEPAVVAPVLSQPSLPMGLGRARALGLSSDEIACARRRFEAEGLSGMALRFKSDIAVPDGRFEALDGAFGPYMERIELEDSDAGGDGRMRPHSVLTLHLSEDPKGATKEAEQRVIAFLKARTAGLPWPPAKAGRRAAARPG